ncbi:hypothetical protein [Demequina mangrovi]|uniref:hypothetical protein n=1 Tax=Demequina mangrovi TaxID=1043493 RepID=UPI00115FD53D|nr:hypothetical protein [Demequina mangrovi]
MSVAEDGLSRRRIIQGVAWATPAIMVATASPPAAASGPDAATIVLAASQSHGTGQNYTVTATVQNGPNTDESLKNIRLELRSGQSMTVTVPDGAAWSIVSGNGTTSVVIALAVEALADSESETVTIPLSAPSGATSVVASAMRYFLNSSRGAAVTVTDATL